MTDRVRCDSCKQMVLTEWPHSCYDFDAVERVREAERKVIEAAVALEFAFRDPSDPFGYTVDAKQDALIDAVRALTAARKGKP